MKRYQWVIGVLSVISAVSIGCCVSLVVKDLTDSYLKDEDEIYIMESGILYGTQEFVEGEDIKFTYDFANNAFETLKKDYGIEQTAGEGTEFVRARRLMNEYAPRLTHESNFTADVEIKALPLLKYALDQKKHGLNCKCKSEILNEMCLALGIYARKVWIRPYSVYDDECHVVNEIYDTTYKKWIMLDITNDEYWLDETGTPLSILEIREHGANRKFCTPVAGNELKPDTNLKKLKKKHMDDFIYIMKNMVYTEYLLDYTEGETDLSYVLMPKKYGTSMYMISEKSVLAAPMD